MGPTSFRAYFHRLFSHPRQKQSVEEATLTSLYLSLSPMALRRRILISAKSENSTICTHDCYPFTSPPLPSPLSSGDSSSSHRLIANILITGVSLASAALFLVLTYYTVLARRRRSDDPLAAGSNNSDYELEEEDASYPFWNILTVGLNESAINSITAKPYIAGAGVPMADCSVCLGDLREGELVRRLPSCGHTFHVPCIDTWLRANISCPLCRSNIVDPDAVSASGEEGNTQTGDQRVSEDLEVDGVGERETVAVTDSARDCTASSTLQARVGLQESVSLQETVSSLTSDLSLNMDREERSEDRVNQKQGSSFREERQQKNPPDFGGSTSGSGRNFFFSRYGRSRSSSVLPL